MDDGLRAARLALKEIENVWLAIVVEARHKGVRQKGE